VEELDGVEEGSVEIIRNNQVIPTETGHGAIRLVSLALLS